MRKRWSDTQTKANNAARERAISASIAEAIKRKYKKSWSATMPPYYGTVLCPDQGKNKEN